MPSFVTQATSEVLISAGKKLRNPFVMIKKYYDLSKEGCEFVEVAGRRIYAAKTFQSKSVLSRIWLALKETCRHFNPFKTKVLISMAKEGDAAAVAHVKVGKMGKTVGGDAMDANKCLAEKFDTEVLHTYQKEQLDARIAAKKVTRNGRQPTIGGAAISEAELAIKKTAFDLENKTAQEIQTMFHLAPDEARMVAKEAIKLKAAGNTPPTLEADLLKTLTLPKFAKRQQALASFGEDTHYKQILEKLKEQKEYLTKEEATRLKTLIERYNKEHQLGLDIDVDNLNSRSLYEKLTSYGLVPGVA